MKTLYVASPLSTWTFDEDTTPLMVAEVRRRGGTTWVTTPAELSFVDGQPTVLCRTIELTNEVPFHRLGDEERRPLGFFDVVHLRTDPPFDIEYYYTTILLEMAPRHTLVLNDPAAVRGLNEKLSILLFPDLVTDTIVTCSADEAADFVARVGGKAVAKELGQCSSKGITLLEGSRADVLARVRPLVGRSTGHLMVQRYLPAVTAGETRITCIDGEPLGYFLKVPAAGSFLASTDFGARCVPCELSDRDRRLCSAVGPFLRDRGILFAALDVIDGHLSEINLTSPGLLKHTNDVMGGRLEVDLEDAVERWLDRRRAAA